MQKTAVPGTAKDSAQQQVRTAKDTWNKQVSTYIAAFLDFKQMFNGHPGSILKVKTPISKLDPAFLIEFADRLNTAFNKIASQGESIISLQKDYASKRKTAQVKQTKYAPIIDEKKKWNASAKDHVKNMIEFKKLINGFPNIFTGEGVRIHHEIPKDPVSIIKLILSDNNDLLIEAKDILTRQKELNQKTASIKIASNPLSRFWYNLKSLPGSFSSKPLKKLKIYQANIVSNLGNIKKKCRQVESDILSKKKDEETLNNIIGADDSLLVRFNTLSKTLKFYRENLESYLSSIPTIIEEESSQEDLKPVKQEKQKSLKQDLPKQQERNLLKKELSPIEITTIQKQEPEPAIALKDEKKESDKTIVENNIANRVDEKPIQQEEIKENKSGVNNDFIIRKQEIFKDIDYLYQDNIKNVLEEINKSFYDKLNTKKDMINKKTDDISKLNLSYTILIEFIISFFNSNLSPLSKYSLK